MRTSDRTVLVWDLPTRLFHWLAAALVAACYITSELNWIDWHELCGDALLALLLFRLAWGFCGSETARFGAFLARPRAALNHLARLFHREPDLQVGHNPAGGWMVVILLAILFGETLTGVYVANDIADQGPFTALMPAPIADAIFASHAILWDVLVGAIALHVAAIIVYAAAKRHNLLLPMITGRKRLPETERQPRVAGALLATVLFALCVLATAAIATYM